MQEIHVGQVWESHDKKRSKRQVRVDLVEPGDQTTVCRNVETDRSTLITFKTLREHWVLIRDADLTRVMTVAAAPAKAADPPAPASV